MATKKELASLPSTPMPLNASEKYDNTSLSMATQNIITATFSLIGEDFLRCLAKELARWTQTQTVMVQQLMTLEDLGAGYQMDTHFKLFKNASNSVPTITEHSPHSYSTPEPPEHDANNKDGRSSSRSSTSSGGCMSSGSSSSSGSGSTTGSTTGSNPDSSILDSSSGSSTTGSSNSAMELNDRVLVTRAIHSATTPGEAMKENTAVPLSSLHDSPYAKTLFDEIHYSIQDHSYVTSYPHCQSFVGLRLDAETESDTWLGVMCVMDDKPMDMNKISFITNLLDSVRERTARELERLRDKEYLIRTRNAARLDAENRVKFLADMSHEIRTPMNAVIALTDLLLQERSSLNNEQKEHLEVIQTSGNHLLTIINDILDLSKLNHDPKFKLESRCFSLRKCVKDTLNMARHQASMSQHNKIIYVTELPDGIDKNLPLSQMTSHLDSIGVRPRPQRHQRHKTLLPLIWDIDERVPDYLMGDTMRLTQIMLNLCSNAVKFTKQGGVRIRIKLYIPSPTQSTPQRKSRMSFKQRYNAKMETIWNETMCKDKESSYNTDNTAVSNLDTTGNTDCAEKVILEISVTDSGIGIPADRLPKLFKSFSQIDISTARQYGGTGLGLAISSTLANHMGGALWVESEEDVGSCFGFTLPMTVAQPSDYHSTKGDRDPITDCATSPPSPSTSASDVDGSDDSSSAGMSGTDGQEEDNDPNTTSFFPEPCLPPSTSATITNTTTLSTAAASPATSSTIFAGDTSHSIDTGSQSDSHLPTGRSAGDHYQKHQSSQPQQPLSPPISQQQQNQLELRLQDHRAVTFSASESPVRPCLDYMTDLHESSSGLSPTSPNDSNKRPLSTPSNGLENKRKDKTASYNKESQRSSRSISRQHNQIRKTSIRKEGNTAQLYPMKIMLAEDNELNQKIAISILKRLGYNDVSIANNGSEVLQLMQQTKFDVIFMDLYMPEMDGLEATRAIIDERARKRTDESSRPPLLNVSDVYIVALTASAAPRDRQICIDTGMNDFISKPFTMLEMKSSLYTCYSTRKKKKTTTTTTTATDQVQ